MAVKKAKEQDEKLKGLTPKEREEFKKFQTRLSGKCFDYHHCYLFIGLSMPGRQLFERNRDWDTSEDSLLEEDSTSVDISQYERTRLEEEDGEDEDHVRFSDSE
jgi:hypothetical protein